MSRIALIVTVFAVLAGVAFSAAPATAAVRIAPSLELELPDFMPEVTQGTIVVLDQRAEWPSLRPSEQ